MNAARPPWFFMLLNSKKNLPPGKESKDTRYFQTTNTQDEWKRFLNAVLFPVDFSRPGCFLRFSSLPFCVQISSVEVIIHVCDEVKNTSKDFSCPQNLLVSKMGYFADVTAGQKLEDMDISVHCDIQIFDWLMKWVKKDQGTSDPLPQLDAANVVPILVSASFLQVNEVKFIVWFLWKINKDYFFRWNHYS